MAERKVVLLVESNEDNRTVYRTILEHFGYEVLEARDGVDSIQLAREHRPGLILMSRGLPRVNGWEATRVLKAHPSTAYIPIIGMSAAALAADVAKAREAGCDAFLAKPCEPRRVVAEVERFIGPGRVDEP
jgi:two-component system, cell cycle response regulator DivK